MRTRIYLRQLEDGSWDDSPDAPYADVSSDEPLTEDFVEDYRSIGRLAITPRECPHREPMSQR